MKPARFGYRRAHDVTEVVGLLHELGEDAMIIAGGQSLVALMNFRLAQPSHLVDIGGLTGLSHIERVDGRLHLGALTTHHAVESSHHPAFTADFAVLRDAMRWVGHLPIRTRGTIGGSIAHADATAEWCLLGVLLDARIAATGPGGARCIDAADFFQGFYTTTLEPEEIITEVIFPVAAPHAALTEYSDRRGDFATMATAVSLDIDEDGETITGGAVAVAGASPTPVRIPGAEAVLAGGGTTHGPLFQEVAAAVFDTIRPASDSFGSANYRRVIARTLVVRACRAAAGLTPPSGLSGGSA